MIDKEFGKSFLLTGYENVIGIKKRGQEQYPRTFTFSVSYKIGIIYIYKYYFVL